MQETETAARTEVEISSDELRLAYRIGVRSRATEELIVRMASRGDVAFAIWGPGEEVHGTAAALGFYRAVNPEHFGLVPHYRSGCLATMWAALNGRDDFTADVLRQQLSKDTDPMSRGRQMVYHLDVPEIGILPLQSPVGMQLDKGAGYAMGYKVKGIDDGVVVSVIGDGTTAEGDMHDAMNAASVWDLPFILMVTDNEVAISTKPHEGRGIVDFASYAAGFGIRHMECDGRDWWDTFETHHEAGRYAREEQLPVLLHVKNLPRFNAHSSAADMSYDLSQDDPLIHFGEELVARGVLEEEDILRRKEGGEGRDFFAHHELGRVMDEETDDVRSTIDRVKEEPDPAPESIFEHIYPPFPEVAETPAEGGTQIHYAGAIRAALDHIIADHGGMIWGQDVARLGGVMTATAGIQDRHPERILDSPLNEPMILGTACGLGLHDGIVALPEIQFGDYSLNAFHWLVHMGNLYWSTNGQSRFSVIMRTPTDPFGGGAIYHSMSVDGYFTPIPGLVIVMPATSFDVYGLLLTAAEYRGSVVVLEPKWMYRQTKGPAFPDEPTDEEGIEKLKKRIMRGGIPEIDPSVRVPFGSAATRRGGSDVTIVAWGRAVWTCMDAAESLAEEGIDAEVIDLRTLVPPDLETVYASVQRTGRLVVAAEDRPFAGFVRSIQGHVVERFPGMPTRAIGQKNVPGIAQAHVLEEATILTDEDVVVAAREVMEERVVAAEGWAWIPPRFYVA